MPRIITISTLWTAAWRGSNVGATCPGEHQLPDRLDVRHVITRTIDDVAAAAYLAECGITLRPDQVLGSVPPQMSPDGYLISTRVTDPDELAAFAPLMAPNEQLGTVPAAGRPPILLTADEFGDLLGENHRGPGDVLFHREGLPHYDVPSQNADRAAWLAGRFDSTQVEAWTAHLAHAREHGMMSQRLRILSTDLTDDERMSVFAALPVIAREEEIRILHRGEHPIPDMLDHDYWIARPVGRSVLVARSHYSDAGEFLGAEVIPLEQHAPYLRDQQLIWAAGMPYTQWLDNHRDLQKRAA